MREVIYNIGVAASGIKYSLGIISGGSWKEEMAYTNKKYNDILVIKYIIKVNTKMTYELHSNRY